MWHKGVTLQVLVGQNGVQTIGFVQRVFTVVTIPAG